jgi:peroxiredoxin
MVSFPQTLLQPGTPAPDFTLPAIHEERSVSLGDYRGGNLLLALFVGLYCPFCRRNIAQLGTARDKLRAEGVETLGVVATEVDNARLYFKYRPSRVALVADPELTTHRLFGVPKLDLTDEAMQTLGTLRVNPNGHLPEPMPIMEAAELLTKLDAFQPTEADIRDRQRQFPQLKGQFLIDREGLVRWASVECGTDGLAGLSRFPSDDELLVAVRSSL